MSKQGWLLFLAVGLIFCLLGALGVFGGGSPDSGVGGNYSATCNQEWEANLFYGPFANPNTGIAYTQSEWCALPVSVQTSLTGHPEGQ